MSKILITGINGQLGHDVSKQLNLNKSYMILSPGREQLDLTNKKKVEEYLSSNKPDVIVHCAAYTAVDKAESEKELAFDVNVNGTKYLTEYCKENNCKIVYISTDYVFDGSGNQPFEINSPINPINYYGFTKAQGEKIIVDNLEKYFIIRISWVFGINGNNFVKTMINLSKKLATLNVINDQIGSPTYTKHLAECIQEMIDTEKYGIYHATNEGYCSWYDFAKEIFAILELDTVINPITTEEYPTDAKRPKNSRLSKVELKNNGFENLPTWQNALREYLKELKENE
ncbi:dTDP-4-dehydrorhamnose reductase [Macrococcus animalis]|uniref:dTDP-4-dehydrorhamnose reductase n=1 Tax=Macrococcus animalis TaxID=3395467 RepID=UPI0039BECDE1